MWRTVFVLQPFTLIVAIHSARGSTSAAGTCYCDGPVQQNPDPIFTLNPLVSTAEDTAQCADISEDGNHCDDPDRPICICSTAYTVGDPPAVWWCDHDGMGECVGCLEHADYVSPEICCPEEVCGTEDPDYPGNCGEPVRCRTQKTFNNTTAIMIAPAALQEAER
ncbi:unnamed protein product, partial [Ectocarpus sp. 6 AP-2014]